MFSVSLARSVALVVTALLLASAPVAALDLGDALPAEGPAATAEGRQADGRPTESPLVPNAMNAQQILEDPPGDTEFEFLGDNPAAGGDADAPIDILSLGLAETDRELVFSLQHRAYPETEATLSSVAIMNAYCQLQFRINGDGNLTYGIAMDYMFTFGGGYENWASLYRLDSEADQYSSIYYGDHIAGLWTALVGGDHFEIVVPKEFLVGDVDGKPLSTGDRVTDLNVDCARNSGTLFISYIDEAADPKGRYTITMAPSTQEIALGLPEDAAYSVAVPVGKRSKVSVEVENLLQRKLLVNLTAEVVGADGQPLQGWTVTSAPTLEMKSNATTPVSLIVSVDATVPHRDGGVLRVTAFPLGFEDKATFTTRVYATMPLGPEQNTLYFHRGDMVGYYCSNICIGGGGAFDEVSDSQPDVFVMNVLQTDPVYDQAPGVDDGVALLSSDYSWAYLDAPLGASIRFDPEGFVDFTVALKSEVARDVSFSATIWTSEEGYLAHFDETIEVTESFQTHTFSSMVNPEMTDIPRDGSIGIGIQFRETIPSIFGGDTWISSIEWDPAQTLLTLPLVGVPEPEVNITDGRALPSIVLGNTTDKEEYVNPGDAQAFDLVLLNEGTQRDTLRLTTKVSESGWDVRFEPGNRFELDAGGSAPLCMSVTAPTDAKEGDVVNVTLTATSKLDEHVKTEIDLVLLVTNYDIEPRTCSEISEEDFVKPITDEEESPGLGTALLLGVVGLLAVAARRRST